MMDEPRLDLQKVIDGRQTQIGEGCAACILHTNPIDVQSSSASQEE